MNIENYNLTSKAETLLEIDRPREAIQLLTKVMADDPDNYHATCLMTLCFLKLNDNLEALNYSEAAIQISPEEEWGHRLRSVVLGELGRKKEALDSAKQAIRLAPELPETLQNLTNMLLICGKAEEAEDIVKKILELAPDSESTHITAGNVYLDMEYYHSAEKHFRQALRINPTSYEAQNNLGVVALRRDESSDGAVEFFSRAVKLEPANELAIENLRFQFSILPQLALFIVFTPIALIGVFIAPIVSVILVLGGIYQLIRVFFANFKNRHQLAVEFRILFKSGAIKDRVTKSIRLLSNLVREFFARVYLGYVLALIALCVRLMAFQFNSEILRIASLLIFFASPYVISRKMK